MESWPQRHRITVDEYYRMAEIGVLAPDARVELIEGEIIDMAPLGPGHASVVDQLPLYARYGVAEVWIVDLQHGCLLAYSGLADGQYRTTTSTEHPGVVTLAALPELRVDLSQLLESS